ncbi:transient receptor potential cation channel protein painless-like [Anopheles cruzii]|uniref:transient receptor potential cation channel protein painless-like n=1 Tax=Anopheles cruzii TaxID=68878 RepID=UPI0022EC41F7|nr:transient receptor potential cation channel protein painless-like [Anopheles cruzii]
MLAIDIVECPQKDLRNSLENKKINVFKTALSRGADVNKRESGNKYSVFEYACRNSKYGDFIKECLENGAIVTRIHPKEYAFPIHLVALSCSAENMEALLTSKDVVVDQKYKDRTALYLLFENIDQENHREGLKCIELLLSAGANINAVQEDNVSPVQLLLEKVANGEVPSGDNEWPKHVLEYCLKESAVNLSLNDGKAQTLISQHFSSLDIPERHGMSNVTVELLKNKLFIGRYTSEDFIEIYKQFSNHLVALSNEELKDMIQIAVCSDKLKAAQHLINPRLDGTTGTVRENLLETLFPGLLEKCCNRGIYSALEWLLQIIPKTARAFINKEPLLCILIKRMNAEVNLMKRSFSKCFYLLLHDPRIELDMCDKTSKRTALHYAVMYKMQPVQLALLGKGAQLGSMDILGNICEIDPILWEKYLDRRLSKAIVDDARFDVIIDLSDFIKSTSPTKETKWESEIYPILQLAQHPANKRLLLHPVISTIVQLKLNYLCRASLVYVMYHFIHWIGLTCLMVYCGDIYLGQSNVTLYWYFVLALIFIFARMFISYAVDRENFLQRSESWLQIMLTIVMICAIVVKVFSTVHEEIYRSCCATAVMLLSVEFTAVLAKVSSFSISTNLILLKAILINFCKSLIPFSSILIAWALTLHILFKERHHMDSAALGETGTQKNNTVEQVTGNNEFNKFQTVWLAGIKTIVMMTGEFDATNIPFEDCVLKSVIFLMFIFFVALVFNNFINGLAVDDTMTMRAESEYISLKQKIFLIHRLETILNLLWTRSNAFNWSWLSQETTTIKLPQYIKIQQKPPSEHACKFQWHNLKRMFKGLKDEEKKETIVMNEENCHILNRALEILNSCAEAHYFNTETTKNLNDSASDDRHKLILGGQTKRRHSI